MGLGPTKFQRGWWGLLNYAQIALSTVVAIKFPGWIRDGYLVDCYFEIGNFCMPLWLPVSIAVYGSLIGGIVWTILKKRDTGSWW
jgi:hypothetical protein